MTVWVWSLLVSSVFPYLLSIIISIQLKCVGSTLCPRTPPSHGVPEDPATHQRRSLFYDINESLTTARQSVFLDMEASDELDLDVDVGSSAIKVLDVPQKHQNDFLTDVAECRLWITSQQAPTWDSATAGIWWRKTLVSDYNRYTHCNSQVISSQRTTNITTIMLLTDGMITNRSQ